jgi:hypothetical protein
MRRGGRAGSDRRQQAHPAGKWRAHELGPMPAPMSPLAWAAWWQPGTGRPRSQAGGAEPLGGGREVVAGLRERLARLGRGEAHGLHAVPRCSRHVALTV